MHAAGKPTSAEGHNARGPVPAFESESQTSWIAKFARAVDQIDQADTPYALLDAINDIVAFQMAMSVVYRHNAGPSYVCDTFREDNAKRALGRYITGTYVLNPVYNAYLKGLKSGVYRMKDLAPDAYFSSEHYQNFEIHLHEGEEIGYRTHGWPKGMEELIVAIEMPDDELAEISLSRLSSEGGFSSDCIIRLNAFMPLIGAVFRQYWRRARASQAQSPKLSLDHLLEGFGEDRLSLREREVVQLILKGHSSESISFNMGISVSTVKTHRQNLYAKLNLSTQQELFSAFLTWLQSQRPAYVPVRRGPKAS